MTSKETFCALIRALEETNKHTDELCEEMSEAIRKHRPEQDYSLSNYQLWPIVTDTRLEDTLVSELEKEFEDDESYVSYFIYELDYGKKSWASHCGNNADGSPISLTSPEELYDLLIYNLKEKRAENIFGTACQNDAPVKKPYKSTLQSGQGTATEVECFDYTGPEDKVAMQLFTQMYFSDCGGIMKGRNKDRDLTVVPGNTVVKFNDEFYVFPTSIISRL